MSQNPRWKDMRLDGVVRNIKHIRSLTQEEGYLVQQALIYSTYWGQMRTPTNSSTASSKETT
ncbi:hypothetical protein [Verrucomicrobium spinosum]|uniref:hypothetical protein n=1 Tax=Verrucomicrobium spinosum TaxID=2736 RepID=UPI001E2A309C|nr:hypothetical protein [Verrucomicrobium spinosum]